MVLVYVLLIVGSLEEGSFKLYFKMTWGTVKQMGKLFRVVGVVSAEAQLSLSPYL